MGFIYRFLRRPASETQKAFQALEQNDSKTALPSCKGFCEFTVADYSITIRTLAKLEISRRKLAMDTLKQDPNYNVVLRLMRGLYQYNKRAAELEEFGIDLYKLAPITELMQATYMAIGVPPEVTSDELMEPGEHWDWGAVLYGLYDETDGSDEEFLQIADELREEYQKGLIDSDDDPL